MSLYISNPSRQNVEFPYRLGVTNDNSGPLRAFIPSGQQIEIGQRWTREQTAYVIQQIEAQGGANAAVVHGHTKITGLIWREQGVISEDEIKFANESVEEDAVERSVAQVTRSAAAFDRVANTNRGRQKMRLAKQTTVEIEQEIAPHAHLTGDEVRFSLTVDPEARGDMRVPGLTP